MTLGAVDQEARRTTACPRCGAQPTGGCRNPTTRAPKAWIHPARRKAYLDLLDTVEPESEPAGQER